MPPPISNLSRHHIPEIPETDVSLSFEIPSTVDSADLLLANKSDDFLNGVDCSLTTPPPPKRTLDIPLTLSELTPTHQTAQVESVRTPPPSLRRRTTKSPETLRARPSPQKTSQSFVSSRLNMIKLADSPVSAKRFANLQAEVDSLRRDSMEEVQRSKPMVPQIEATNPVVATSRGELNLPKGGERKARTKPTVIEGGITKKVISNKLPRSKFSRDLSAASRTHKPANAASQLLIRPPRDIDKITTNETKITTTNVPKTDAAERLIMLSERLMTDGLFSFDHVGDSEHDRHIPANVSPSTNKPSPSKLRGHNQDVFTLSEISPRKDDSSHSAVKPAPQSPAPARTGGKRPISAISDPSLPQPCKRGKTAAPAPTRRSPKPNVPALQPSSRKNGVASGSKLPSSPHRRGLRTRQVLALKGEDKETRTTSDAPGHFRQSNNLQKQPKIAGNQKISKSVKPGTSSATWEQTAHLPPAKPTKPVGFTFRSDIRLEARRAGHEEKAISLETSKPSKSHNASIPDFKSLHAAELQASLTFRKEHIAPTVPVTPALKTKSRAEERERFDEMIRRREEEMDRIKEEKRKAMEEAEEIEVKELRKRTIPKAHEVPKWYEDAPKKGGSVHR